ncbi:MAG: SpoVR family protein [Planctomycetia bacterium]|nr:SpoVR family protein [Planctomycetia bacterium]
MSIHSPEPLPAFLADIQGQMEGYARSYGLDFFPTIFEVVDYDQLNAIAAYGGFPTRYPHWRFGMEYEELSKGYVYGLQKIYELVINNNPCYAYLMRSNGLTDQKLVMAHVYGHCDFFKCNEWFKYTNRKMMDQMANHGNRIRRYMDRFGVDEVEQFIDACLSIEDLIDIHSQAIKRFDDPIRYTPAPDAEDETPRPGRFAAKGYMEQFVNPPGVMREEAEALKQRQVTESNFPATPARDVMLFLLEHAPLRPWQLDVLSIIRDEAYYFVPQAQTKIMNEGWASYWHSMIMTRHGLEPGDVINYADHNAGTLATSPGRLNPYKLGVEMYRSIEERWNTGRHGRDYEACDDLEAKRTWNTEENKGREKIFEVRRIHNDLTFIDEFLTLEFCQRHKMFSFGYNEDSDAYEIETREFPKIKQRLMFSLTNRGRPSIRVRDANYKNRGELFLEHDFNGVELQTNYARDTLANLVKLWTRPVHIETVLDDVKTVISYDGHEHSVRPEGKAAKK